MKRNPDERKSRRNVAATAAADDDLYALRPIHSVSMATARVRSNQSSTALMMYTQQHNIDCIHVYLDEKKGRHVL